MPFTVSIYIELTADQRHYMEVCYACHCIDFHWIHNRSMILHGSLLSLSLYRFSLNSLQINDTACKSAMPYTVSIFTELTTDQWHCMVVCSTFHCIDFHRTHYRSMTLLVSLLCLLLYRFSLNSLQINDIAWKSLSLSLYRFSPKSLQINDTACKSAMPFTVSIFIELTTDQWHCMEVCSAFHCIDFHWTHYRSMTLHGSLLYLSLYRFSPNSQQINDIAWKPAMPVTVSIFTELTTDQWQCMEVCYAFYCIDFHPTHYRSMTLHVSLLCLLLYRFSLNSLQINDIAWKFALPFTVSIFTELTTDQRYCMEACYACHCIDFHWTHYRSMTMHGSLLCRLQLIS